jgi:cytosolic carboxypeptidase protein 2/3
MTAMAATSGSALANRVHDIIRRMNDNLNQSEATKTCYGILAIMSREESSKVIIVRNGLEIILNGMQIHLEKGDVQEAGCDLIWSLAFNNALVKEMIGNINGTHILVRGLKRHYKSPEYLKSACGALSNLCQFKLNQQNFAAQGGLQPLLHSIPFHQTNLKLLPFIFDALASLIVGNEDNARIVTSQDGIAKILTVLAQHRDSASPPEIVKSGCHTLAILSDIKGHASKIAQAGGVMIILPLLDLHSAYSDLHRVAAVVLLRMLQESTQVVRDIIAHEGVRILLKSLEKGGAQQDTVAALTHILATVTNPLTTASLTSIESQLWISSGAQPGSSRNQAANPPPDGPVGDKRSANRSFARSDPRYVSSSSSASSGSAQGASAAAATADCLNVGIIRKPSSSHNHSPPETTTALGGLVRLMGQYSDRKDVSRASCRLLSHLVGTYPGVGMALDKLFILDRITECLDHHSATKDILESACAILKALHKRSPLLSFSGQKLSSVRGLLFLLRAKCSTDEEIFTAATEILTRLLGVEIQRPAAAVSSTQCQAGVGGVPLIPIKGMKATGGSGNNASSSVASPVTVVEWGQDSLSVCSLVLENLAIGMRSGVSVDRLQTTPAPPQDRSGSNPAIMPPVVIGNSGGGTGAGSPSRVGTAPVTGGGPLPGMAWSKTTPKLLTILLDHLELLLPLLFRSRDSSAIASLLPDPMIPSLQAVHSSLPARHAPEFSGRLTHLLSSLQHLLSGPSPQEINPLLSLESSSLPASRQGESRSAAAAVERALSKSGILEERDRRDWDPEPGNGSGPFASKPLPRSGLDSSGSKKSLSAQESSPPPPMERLLQTHPPFLEPLATDSGQSTYTPSYGGRMQLCYENCSLPGGKSLQSRCPVPVPYSVPPGGLGLPFHHTLQFSSEFESGNLYRAIQRDEREYDLFLRPDLHTPGHTQWFFFSVSSLLPAEANATLPPSVLALPLRVKFNIVNLTKPDSLFNQGMKPVLYALDAARSKGTGWLRSGSNISYFANSYPRSNSSGEGNESYYTLSFTMELLPSLSDTFFIAYYYPYTYSDHKAHLQTLLAAPASKERLRAVKLCTTLGGYDCDLLIVTNFRENKETLGPLYTPPQTTLANPPSSSSSPVPSYASALPTPSLSSKTKSSRGASSAAGGGVGGSQYRKGIVVSARVHPGEPPASFMMKGFIDFLVSAHPIAALLRSLFVFYLVPILNPDGVIFGNNRCNLSGVDLNRQWKTPLKSLHPTVYALKSLLQDQRGVRDLYMFLDLHGHSRKYNVFLYGVDDSSQTSGPNPNYSTGSPLSLSALPSLLSSSSKKTSSSSKAYSKIRSFAKFFSLHSLGFHYVSYSDCSFHIRKGRESTARVIVAKEIGIPLSYTIEATFCGVNSGPLQSHHMNIGHYAEVGMSLCDVILQYGVAEGDISETVWANYLRATGGGKDLVLKSKMIREEGEGLSGRSSSRVSTSRSTSSGSVIRDSSSVALFSRQTAAAGSRRGTLRSEGDGDGGAMQDPGSGSGREVEVDAVDGVAAEPGEEGELKEGEDDSDADGEEDDDAKGSGGEKRDEEGFVGADPQLMTPSPDQDEEGEELDDDARSLSLSPSPPGTDSGLQGDPLSNTSGGKSERPQGQPTVPSARRLIHTAGGDTYRSSACLTGRSETAPSSSIIANTTHPLSYPGYAAQLSHHSLSSSADHSVSLSSASPSSGSVKRIARDDGFTFSESVLANRMIAGLNTVVTSASSSQDRGTTASTSLAITNAAASGGKSSGGGGSVPLIPTLNEANRSGLLSPCVSSSVSPSRRKGVSSIASSTTGSAASGSGSVSMRPKKATRKGGMKTKKTKRKVSLTSRLMLTSLSQVSPGLVTIPR